MVIIIIILAFPSGLSVTSLSKVRNLVPIIHQPVINCAVPVHMYMVSESLTYTSVGNYRLEYSAYVEFLLPLVLESRFLSYLGQHLLPGPFQ